MNTQTISRSFFWGLAVTLFALLFIVSGSNALAQGGENASSTPRGDKKVDTACMAEAVSDREEALIDAWKVMSSSTMEALKDRKEGLADAWSLTGMKERTLALVKVWKEWRTDKKMITAEFRKDRKAAWDTFKRTAKTECKTALPKDENLEKTTSDSIAI